MCSIGKTRLSSLPDYQLSGTITVPKGETYVVRTDTPELNAIIVFGTLLFDRTTEQTVLTVRARLIDVMPGGRLLVGTAMCAWPADKVVEFELIGGNTPEAPRDDAGRVERQLLRVREGGELSMHGSHTGATWSKLRQSLDVGDTRVRTARSMTFRKGQSVILTSTDYDNVSCRLCRFSV